MRGAEPATFIDCFEAHAERSPTRVAAEDAGLALTYGELDARANGLAKRLVERGIGAEAVVALHARPGLAWLTAVLAIWKAGGAYLPLAPSTPTRRRSFMLEDSAPSLVLADEPIEGSGRRVLALEPAPARSASAPHREIRPGDLAYVLFTSGSSGQPKAVELEQRGLTNLMDAQRAVLGVEASDRVLQYASLAFDASIAELVMALGTGATLCFCDPKRRVGPELVAFLREQRISALVFPPSLLDTLGSPELPDLRVLNVAGEPCGAELVERWAPGRTLFNHYGPTEATVWASVDRCEAGRRPTIGRAIPGVELLVADPDERPLADGEAGELWIGGLGVGRGYRARPALTAERFVCRADGSRWYKSGDRARRLADGRFEYLGRFDRQVKVRGQRVELDEVEAVLRTHPTVREAAVVLRDDELVAYVASPEPRPKPAELVAHMALSLPDAMIPSVFVSLDRFPRTESGKLDRRALPEPRVLAGREPVKSADEHWIASRMAELLGVESVGRHDDFFALGGHSLAAARLLEAIRAEYRVTLAFDSFARAPTPADLARELGEAPLAPGEELEPSSTDTGLVSAGQRRLWLVDQLDPGRTVENAPLLVRLGGAVAPTLESVLAALDTIVARHEVLRTTFDAVAGEPVARIAAPGPFAARVVEREAATVEEEAERALERVREMAQEPFDLARGPLLRATAFRDRDAVTLALVFHHSVIDAWSVGVLLCELAQLVRGEPLAELRAQYRDYAAWERRHASPEEQAASLEFWTRTLAELPRLALPADHPEPKRRSRRGARAAVALDVETTRALRELAKAERGTPFMVLLAAFDVLLARHTGQTDIAVGVPLARRAPRGTEALIGFFVNTVVLRNDLSGCPTFREVVRRVRRNAVAAYAHAGLPFDHVVRMLRPDRSWQSDALFRVQLVLEDTWMPPLERGGLELDVRVPDVGTAMHDLTLFLESRDGALAGHLEYDTELFDADSAARMAGAWTRLATEAVRNPDRPIADLPVMSESDRRRVMVEWNATARAILDLPVHAAFSRQAARTPSATAVVGPDGRTLDYRELDERSNQLARHLDSRGARGRTVALHMGPSVSSAISLLAVLKAGAACVPLDAGAPRERLLAALADARAPLLVVSADSTERTGLMLPGIELVDVEQDADRISRSSRAPLESGVGPEDAAYLLYTSGSTGRPKGVLMPHRGLANLIAWHTRVAPGCGVTLGLAPLSFDVSFQEAFSAWCSGGTLLLAHPTVRTDPEALGSLISARAVERAFFPPAILQALAERFRDHPSALRSLRWIFASGDRLHLSRAVVVLFEALSDTALFNHYGPTETHVVTSYRLPDNRRDWPEHPPIGRPIDNARLYLLDQWRRPVPPGVAGEIHVAGPCLALGYFGRDDWTAERFVPAPREVLGGPADEVWYRTGDLARARPDGTLEFLGRIDRQVKIRGHRVEPGEIEAVLLEDPAVRAAAVVARPWPTEAGPLRLLAYVVPASEARPKREELVARLRQRLSDPMLPAEIMVLDALPLSTNGKVDLAALPEQAHRPLAHAPPRTDIEGKIAAIWREVLGRSDIGREDVFFELGGHSLQAMQIATRVGREFSVRVRPRDVFERPTVAAQGVLVEELLKSSLAGCA